MLKFLNGQNCFFVSTDKRTIQIAEMSYDEGEKRCTAASAAARYQMMQSSAQRAGRKRRRRHLRLPRLLSLLLGNRPKNPPAPWTGLDHGPLQASRAGGAGDLGGQIKAVRARSRRKMPQLVLVVIVILALSSATAFAAMWAYRTFVAPQPVAVEQGNPEPADPYAGQKAVFDDVLTHYKSASDNGWPTTSYDDDLSNISEVLSGRMLYVGQAHQTDFQGAILSYAYKDLNGDGTLELVIAAVTASDYIPVAAYGIHNGAPQSLFEGKGWQTSTWTLFASGKMSLSGGGQYSAGVTVFTLEDGMAQEVGEYRLSRGDRAPDMGEAYLLSDFEWTPLTDYQPTK